MRPEPTVDLDLAMRLGRELRPALTTLQVPSKEFRDAVAHVASLQASTALTSRPEGAGQRQAFEATVATLVDLHARLDSDVADVGADDIAGAVAASMGELAALDADTADAVLALFAEDADRWAPSWVPLRTRRLVAYAVRTGPVETSHAGNGRFATELPIIALTTAAAVALDGPARPELAWPATPGALADSLDAYPRAATAAATLRDLERSGSRGVALHLPHGPAAEEVADRLPYTDEVATPNTGTRGGLTTLVSQHSGTGPLAPSMTATVAVLISRPGYLLATRDLTRISRDATTLLGVLEVALATGGEVLTPSVLLTSDWVARRARPLGPHVLDGDGQLDPVALDPAACDREHLRRLRELPAMPRSTPADAAPIRQGPRPGRNDPCLCGSGRKYKRCCWA